MTAFASGKHALGICDRCGLTYKLRALKSEYTKQRPNGLLVCDSCCDVDHPQLLQGMHPIHDPQGLRDPRPDSAMDSSREMVGDLWEPADVTVGVPME